MKAKRIFCIPILLLGYMPMHVSYTPRLVVVGGGAAGIFGAIHACSSAASNGVTMEAIVLEQGPNPLSKVKISGGGRCNVCHDDTKAPPVLVENYPRGARELLGPFTATFGAVEAANWFRDRGVALKTERDGRMFPTTDDSDTIVSCLLSAASEQGVQIITKARVTGIKQIHEDLNSEYDDKKSKNDNFDIMAVEETGEEADQWVGHKSRFVVEVKHGDGSVREELADSVLLSPGSSQQALRWLTAFGHKIMEPVPSLFTLNLAEAGSSKGGGGSDKLSTKEENENDWLMGLAGLSVHHATVSLLEAMPRQQEQNAAPDGMASYGVVDDAVDAAKVRKEEMEKKGIQGGVVEGNEGMFKLEGNEKRKKKKKKAKKAKPLLTTAGPLLITHSGLSGPAVLKMSAFAARELHSSGYRATIAINWSGGRSNAVRGQISGGSSSLSSTGDGFTTAAEALAALVALRDHRPDLSNKAVATFCPLSRGGDQAQQQLLPKRLWNAMVTKLSGISPNTKWGSVASSELEKLATELTNCRLHVTGKGTFKDEFVTCGGLALSDVALKRMESRLIPGLFFAGEVLDIDGVTGGFNFQSCWTTGFISGTAIGNDAAAKMG